MDVEIRSYPDTSFYVGESRKRWVYGTFCIYCNRVIFSEKTDVEPKRVVLSFNDVINIHKATTTIIYGAIVLTVKSGETFWFSSFQDRESVFRMLCHFQKNLLINNQNTSKPLSNSQRTEMGTKLLGIATNSVSTLSKAAVMLNQQGEKIDNSSAMMMNIHNDLDIADRMTSGLESWVGRWSLPQEYIMVNPIIIKDNDIPQVFDFDVLYTKIEMGKVCQQLEGVIQISKNGLNILNLKQKILFHFGWPNVSKVRVISPWEMVVIQYQIGKPDISFSFVSSLLINIFGSGTTKNSVTFGQFRQLSVGPGSSKLSTSWGKTTQEQVLKEKQVITNEEVDELSSTLKNLKSMMLAVGEETDIQNEKLDRVTDSVDEANIKLVNVNKRMNKLM
ncbi:hypothetical protein LOTGIDRAFT_172501 [Lottia gigantea]|uniref:Synaptosomal-associated protein 47 n=1 Tax=Lottia gigantea TaxID=225164 RepID=V4B235_LOTGI|nr:hypothetical protein LOTGIDRAFT_172501 [Lottia gigantea]ESP01651.1 hypothetical protein LOTGIDRAFT_172501 [Lottia gigantea]